MARVTAAGKVCGMVERDARRFRRWYDAGGRFFATNTDTNLIFTSAPRQTWMSSAASRA